MSRYQGRLSGPLLDRVDLQVQVAPVTRAELMQRDTSAETTAIVAARVLAARERAAARLAGTPWRTNAEVPGHELRTRWQLAPGALNDAARQLERGLLTARGLDRVLRVAWTVADLAGRDRPEQRDIRTALVLRTGVEQGLPLTEQFFRSPNLAADRPDRPDRSDDRAENRTGDRSGDGSDEQAEERADAPAGRRPTRTRSARRPPGPTPTEKPEESGT